MAGELRGTEARSVHRGTWILALRCFVHDLAIFQISILFPPAKALTCHSHPKFRR